MTSFHTLMLLNDSDQLKQLFREVYLVLQPGGRYLVWDALVPANLVGDKPVAVFVVTVTLGGGTIDAGYGIEWPSEVSSADRHWAMARADGFDLKHPRVRPHSVPGADQARHIVLLYTL